MLYLIFADIVVLIHLVWIVFLAAGVYWARKYFAVMIVHAAGMAFSVISQSVGWYCPLTHLEVWLREHGHQAAGYAGSFIVHYAEQLVYLRISRHAIFIVTIVWTIVTAWIYIRSFSRGCLNTENKTC